MAGLVQRGKPLEVELLGPGMDAPEHVHSQSTGVATAPSSWNSMSDTDRVFPGRVRQGSKMLTTEKRLIAAPARRGGPAGSRTRVVEVVHVRKGSAQPEEERPQSPAWSVRAESWPDGFHANSSKPPLTTPEPPEPPVAPQPAAPVGHLMRPWWEPVPAKAAPASTPSNPVPAESVVTRQRKPRSDKTAPAPAVARSFADPFAAEEEGANCLRCGYLVEPARERRGLLTCAACN